MTNLILGLLGLVLAPVLGGLITGLDRILTARFQSRVGPPLLQPFYDVFKLLGKEQAEVNVWISLCAVAQLSASATAVFLFFSGSDILLIFFVQAVSAVFLCVGAFSTPSPYSQAGASRELLQILAYEPLLILVFVGMSLAAGSFKVADIYAHPEPLLLKLPLLFLVLGVALTIKLRKSPFDIAGSHHAHQELVRGVYTEYAGRYLAFTEIAHFFDVVLILGIVGLFFSTNILAMLVLIALTYLAEIVVDNISARLTWKSMLASAWVSGLGLGVINLIWFYAR